MENKIKQVLQSVKTLSIKIGGQTEAINFNVGCRFSHCTIIGSEIACTQVYHVTGPGLPWIRRRSLRMRRFMLLQFNLLLNAFPAFWSFLASIAKRLKIKFVDFLVGEHLNKVVLWDHSHRTFLNRANIFHSNLL